MSTIHPLYTKDFKELKASGKVALIFGVISLVVSIVALFVSVYQTKDIYHLDRQQYTEMVIRNSIQDFTDLWDKRYAVNVIIHNEEREIGVVIALANGEDVGMESDEVIKRLVRSITESSVEQFEWLKDYKLAIKVL